MKLLGKEEIIDVLVGATLLGAGGGGSLKDGLNAIEAYEMNNPDKEISLKLIDTAEMEENGYAAVVAGMGSPLAFKGQDVSRHMEESYSFLKEHLASLEQPKEINYVLPVELGGFNTCMPMIISMDKDIPLIDADGAGRAVPALETLLFHINGCDTGPLCFSDGNNNNILVKLDDPKNAPLGEVMGRNICIAFNMVAGVAGWPINKNMIETRIANNSLSLCQEVGKLLRETKDSSVSIFDKLDNAKTICFGEIVEITTKIENGFDVGSTIIKSVDGDKYEIRVINENITITMNDALTPFLTSPETITFYDQESLSPLTNADTYVGQKIVLGAIKALGAWEYRDDAHVTSCWRKYYDACGYEGGLKRM